MKLIGTMVYENAKYIGYWLNGLRHGKGVKYVVKINSSYFNLLKK